MSISNETLGGFFAALIGIAAAILGVIPRFDVAMAGVLAIVIIVTLAVNKITINKALESDMLTVVLLVFCLYLALTSLWAVRFDKSLTKALMVAALVLTCLLTLPAIQNFSQHRLRGAVLAMVAGFAVSLGYLLVELLTDHGVIKLAMNTVLEHKTKFVTAVDADGRVTRLNPSYYNKAIALVIMALWPALLGLAVWQRDASRRRLFIAGTLLLATVMTFLFECETAKLALVLGAIGYLGAAYLPKTTHWTMSTIWAVTVILMIPLVHLAWNAGVPHSPLLFKNAQARLQIWRATVDHIPENPILGIGINATRDLQAELQKRDPKKYEYVPGQKKTRHWHAHNLFLQTWYELGAVGAAFLLAIGLLLLRQIHRLNETYRPAATATFAAAAGTAAVGWGMWQSWLIAGYAWAVIFLLLVITFDRSRDQAEASG